MLSFWEKNSFIEYDIVIVGSGIVGLNTAIRLKEKHPKSKIVILERGLIPSGASTKNAGFACFGSVSELVADLDSTSTDEMYALFHNRVKGIQLLREKLGDKNICYQPTGSIELLREDEANVLEHIDKFNALFKNINPKGTFYQDNSKIANFGINQSYFKHCIVAPNEGNIDTGKMMQSLIDFAYQKGVTIITGANVQEIQNNTDSINLIVKNPVTQEEFEYKSKIAVLCTNAFTNLLLHNEDIKPGRGQVLITKPIKELKIQGNIHFDQGYYYCRNVGDRILFGGGRNLDFSGEQTTTFGTNEKIIQNLKHHLANNLCPNTPFEIDYSWSGIMAFGKTKTPILKQHNDRIWGAYRLGGMGVALGTQLGIDLANKIYF